MAGEIPATWKYPTERRLPPDGIVASIAPTERYFGSYAANALSKIAADLNFSAFSLSFA